MQGPFVFRVMGLPGDSIVVEKEMCIINGKKNKYWLINKGIPNEDVEDYFKNSIAEYEEQLPNGVCIHIYRIELSDKDVKRYTYGGIKYMFNYNDMKVIKIPENHYFLMGDFRSNANDSRQIGTIPREQIFGKVIEIKPPKKK